MELILAMDLQGGLVVHGERGNRARYRPLVWGASPVADPVGFVRHIRPASIYIADLDRISGTGSHDAVIRECNKLVGHCYADRGSRGPEDLLFMEHFENVIGTETCGPSPDKFHSGYLSIDMREGRVIPSGADPLEFLTIADRWDFKGCILLDISAVGTGSGLPRALTGRLRDAYTGKLVWGGGIASSDDLSALSDAGFDGAIIATAVHKGIIPVELIRRGTYC